MPNGDRAIFFLLLARPWPSLMVITSTVKALVRECTLIVAEPPRFNMISSVRTILLSVESYGYGAFFFFFFFFFITKIY